MTTLRLMKSIGRSPSRLALFLIPLVLTYFALSPRAQALAPPPDGGYPGDNTAEGTGALFAITTGVDNTAIGFHALNSNATASQNTALGFLALHVNTTGDGNTATGSLALGSNRDGRLNTANGFEALRTNQHGSENTATGDTALFANTADGNTADGSGALHDNTAGNGNTATGDTALFFNTIGHSNTADGFQALVQNTIGHSNTADGFQALDNNTTGQTNIAVGYLAGHNLTTGSCNIDIGNEGGAGESNTIRIGSITSREGGCGQTATFIAGIHGVTTGNMDAVPVVIDSAGQLGTVSSSRRFKEEIKPMDRTSEAVLALEPVTFQYKSDSKATPQFGLIAEEVAQVNPDLVIRDANGEIYTVRYDAVNAMLLNEFLKEHRKVEALQASFAQQQKDFQATVAQQQKQIEALTTGLQKVSDQLEVNKAAPQTVANKQ